MEPSYPGSRPGRPSSGCGELCPKRLAELNIKGRFPFPGGGTSPSESRRSPPTASTGKPAGNHEGRSLQMPQSPRRPRKGAEGQQELLWSSGMVPQRHQQLIPKQSPTGKRWRRVTTVSRPSHEAPDCLRKGLLQLCLSFQAPPSNSPLLWDPPAPQGAPSIWLWDRCYF